MFAEKNNKENSLLQVLLFFVFVAIILALFIPHLQHLKPNVVDARFIVSCSKALGKEEITVTDTGFIPLNTRANVCDQLTIRNKGRLYHEVSFGKHPYHLQYPGYTERALKPNQNVTVLLRAHGTFELHDHLNDDIKAILSIQK